MPPQTTLSLSERGRSEISALLQTACERHQAPGVVAAVANREHVLYLGAAGMLDEAGAVLMPADAIFRIASMTKPITSVGIMQLCEQGRLGLDDPVGEYLPEFKGRAVIADFDVAGGSYTTRPVSGEVSIRHLLSHTAGFGYGFSNHLLQALENINPPRALPLLHDPGSRWTYGRSTALLGEVIARVAAQPLDAYFAAHIFRPLGMTDTAFDVKTEDIGRLVTLYHRVDDALSAEPRPASLTPHVSGGGGLLGTAGDYIRFLQMLLNGGALAGTRLLQEQSVAEMTRNQIGNLTVEEQPGAIPRLSKPFPLGAGADKFGLGIQLKTNAEEHARAPGSYSWAGLYNTYFWSDPQKGIAVVLLMQVLPFYDAQCVALLTDFERSIYANLE